MSDPKIQEKFEEKTVDGKKVIIVACEDQICEMEEKKDVQIEDLVTKEKARRIKRVNRRCKAVRRLTNILDAKRKSQRWPPESKTYCLIHHNFKFQEKNKEAGSSFVLCWHEKKV